MALVACWECDSQISDSSPSCPQCGAPGKDSQITQVNAVNDEVAQEIKRSAEAKLIRQGLLKELGAKFASETHEKFFSVTQKGKKCHLSVKWQPYIIDDHNKDKEVTTQVTQRKGTTRNGNSYVKDVDVKHTTTHYDYIDAYDINGELCKFRLVDLDLDKLKTGQVVSLGWLMNSDSQTQGGDIIETGSVYGQAWDGNRQPSLIVQHQDTERTPEYAFQALKASAFHNAIHTHSIGTWHLLWVGGLVYLGFDLYSRKIDFGWPVLAATAGVALLIKGIRYFNSTKPLKQFDEWYRKSLNDEAKRGQEAFAAVASRFK